MLFGGSWQSLIVPACIPPCSSPRRSVDPVRRERHYWIVWLMPMDQAEMALREAMKCVPVWTAAYGQMNDTLTPGSGTGT
jgi:hypothetical protein